MWVAEPMSHRPGEGVPAYSCKVGQAEDTASAKVLRPKTQKGAGSQGAGVGLEWVGCCRQHCWRTGKRASPRDCPVLFLTWWPPGWYTCSELGAPQGRGRTVGPWEPGNGCEQMLAEAGGGPFPGHHSGQPLNGRKPQSGGSTGHLGGWPSLPAHLGSSRLSSEAAMPQG